MTLQVAEQTVYLIGHSSTALYEDLEYEDADGRILCLQDFLKAEGCDEETDICIRSDIYGHRGEADNSDLDMIPEFAGRACYGSYGRKQDLNSRYIGHIIQVGHGSVLEHSVATLAFTGISRSLTHELVRHRLFGYSQRSQRFVDESSFAIAMPPLFQDAGWEEAYNTVIETADTILDAYKRLVEISFDKLSTPKALVQFALREGYLNIYVTDSEGPIYKANETERRLEEWEAMIQEDEKTAKEFEKATSTARRKTAREASRCVLPNCTETKIYMTGNMRAWRGMLDQRASIHADREIRSLAMKVLRTLRTIAPNIFSDYKIKLDSFGVEYAETHNRKV